MITFLVIIIGMIALGLFMRNGMEIDMLFGKKNRYGKLLSVSYSNSGDMNGNIDRTSLNVEKMLITTEYSPAHDVPTEVSEYSVTEEEVDTIEKMIKEYQLLKLSKLPMGDLFAYDAPTTTLNFTYDNSSVGGSIYDNYSINYYMKLSKSDLNKLHKFTDYLNSLLKKENLVRSYVENEEEDN